MAKDYISQIYEKTGLTGDYANEYAGASLAFAGEFEGLIRFLKMFPIKEYSKKYNIQNPEENPRIPILDSVADFINKKVEKGKLTLDLFLSLFYCVDDILKGR